MPKPSNGADQKLSNASEKVFKPTKRANAARRFSPHLELVVVSVDVYVDLVNRSTLMGRTLARHYILQSGTASVL